MIALAFLVFTACGGSDSGEENEDGDSEVDGDDPTDGDEVLDGDEETSQCPAGFEYSDAEGKCVIAEVDCPEGFKQDESKTKCIVLSDWDIASASCGRDSLEIVDNFVFMDLDGLKPNWDYKGYSSLEETFDVLSITNFTSDGAPSKTGTYDIKSKDTSLADCSFCFLVETDCTKDQSGERSCDMAFMPMEIGSYTLKQLGKGLESPFKGNLNEVVLQEVTIGEDGKTTPVEDGETWCMDGFEFSGNLPAAGFVNMDRPEGVNCDYPEGPYFFWGPGAGVSNDEPGTVPPMSWPGAYIDGQPTGFDLAQYRCDNPDVKTLYVILGAGWCSACHAFMGSFVCGIGTFLDDLHALNGEALFVVGDNNTPGSRADNQFANDYVDKYECDGGIRLSDIDNTGGRRVIWASSMHAAIPWVAVIRMSDMKLTHRGYTDEIDFYGIAEDNNE